jgi:hypothetical protein
MKLIQLKKTIKEEMRGKKCIIKLFPPRESLVSDIPAGGEKSLTFFYSVAFKHNTVIFILGHSY